jgi:Heterokaryon incompatibility protein (HET)
MAAKLASPKPSLYPSPKLDLKRREIRLLWLDPGGWNDRITSTLTIAILDADLQFNALSYAWGDPNVCKPIFVNGRRVELTTNLESALRRLRSPTDEISIWWMRCAHIRINLASGT